MINKKWKKEVSKMKQGEIDNELLKVCEQGNFEKMSYLLTSPDLKIKADILSNDGSHVKWAADEGHNELVKYMLISPELSQHADVHFQQDGLFFHAALRKNWELLNFLIIDYNIPYTKWIKEWLDKEKNILSIKVIDDINNMFELRKLNTELHTDLTKTDNKKEFKIKL